MPAVYAPYAWVFAVVLLAPLLIGLTTQDYGPYLAFLSGNILTFVFRGKNTQLTFGKLFYYLLQLLKIFI